MEGRGGNNFGPPLTFQSLEAQGRSRRSLEGSLEPCSLVDLVLTWSRFGAIVQVMKSVTTHDAKTQLSALLKAVEAGEEVEILRGSTPVARLVPTRRARRPKRPKTGTITSPNVRYAADAFEPLDLDAMERWGLV